jgi:energy-coupling factor transport system substrate-specific component
MSWQAGAFTMLGLALAAGFAWYERRRPDARVVALVATLAAFAALGRIAFAALPNVKPTTDIVLVSGYALGAAPGFVVGALAALTSNFFFGQGPWTPWQMVGWGATALLGAGLAVATGRRLIDGSLGRWRLAAVCGVAGFAFTVLQDVGDWVTYSDHSSGQLAVYVGKGLGFDTVHAAGSVLFALAFGPALARSVARFATRLEVRWEPVVPALLAAVVVLGLAGSQARAAATPTGYLLAAQNRDGGFGPSPGQASVPLYSGWVALGLESAGVSPSALSRGGNTLTGYLIASEASGTDPGSLERTILALRAAGVGAGGLVASLERDIVRDGSVADQANLTAFAILALRAAGAPIPVRTPRWLAHQEDADGGFNYGTAGGQSDVDDTGAALEALGRAVPRAMRFILAQQNRDGGFPSSPGQDSNAQSTAWAVQGLVAAGGPAAPVARAIAYLNSLVAPDGHVRYSRSADQAPVWVTGEALMALERKPLPLVSPAAAGWPGDVALAEALLLAPLGLG